MSFLLWVSFIHDMDVYDVIKNKKDIAYKFSLVLIHKINQFDILRCHGRCSHAKFTEKIKYLISWKFYTFCIQEIHTWQGGIYEQLASEKQRLRKEIGCKLLHCDKLLTMWLKLKHSLMHIILTYRIRDLFGSDFNMAVWRIFIGSPNLNHAVLSRTYEMN